MILYVILTFVAILIGMAISVMAFGTGGKRKKIFQNIYFSLEDKSRKTKSDGREKRKAIFEAKTKCAPKIRVALLSVRLSGQNTSVVQTPFESCLNDAFLLKFPLKYHLKLIANSAEIRIFT